MIDLAIFIIVGYPLLSLALAVLLGKMLKRRDGEPSIWKDLKDE